MTEIPNVPQLQSPSAEVIAAARQQAIAAALFQPHQIYLSDVVLKTNVQGGTTTLTMGTTHVNGSVGPLFSVVMSTRFALELSGAIQSAVAEAAPKIREDATFIEEFLATK